MSRLIDADALKSALAHAAKDYCNRNGPMRAIDFESLIDKATTIDAIPVEWLKKRREQLRQKEYGGLGVAAITKVLMYWHEEQEVR